MPGPDAGAQLDRNGQLGPGSHKSDGLGAKVPPAPASQPESVRMFEGFAVG